ncbi:MAG TPA: VOC family protein [Methylomirabilota bacterium]|nr:VOC family protein [Methylomirabilota bacterium]
MATLVPEGYHTVTPYLTIRGAADAIEFYKRAFGAQETERMPGPDGKGIMHAEIRIGDSVVMLADEMPSMGCRAPQTLGGTTSYLFLYVTDVDAAFKRAVDAGAKATMPPTDMFWGDRFGKLTDPFGHEWGLATHKEDVPPEEMKRRAAEAMKQLSAGKK